MVEEGREGGGEKASPPTYRPTATVGRPETTFLKGTLCIACLHSRPDAKDSIKSESTVGRLWAAEKAIGVLRSSEELRCLRLILVNFLNYLIKGIPGVCNDCSPLW